MKVEIDNIKIHVTKYGNAYDSRLVEGLIISPAYDLEKLHPNMPERVKGAKIALLNTPIEVRKTATKHTITIEKADQTRNLAKYQETSVRVMVERIKDSETNVVLCGRRIDPLPQHFLVRHKIMAIRNVDQTDMKRLADATGGKIVKVLEDLRPRDLGKAELVEISKMSQTGKRKLFVEGCINPKAVTLLACGSSLQVQDALNDAVRATSAVVEDKRVVAGGGAIEIELARILRRWSKQIQGVEQLAIDAFADGLESVPITLIETAGMNCLDVMPSLKANHERGFRTYGVDVCRKEIVDTLKRGIIDPFKVKCQALQSAVETAILILRVDDVLKTK